MANDGSTEPAKDGKTILFSKDCPGGSDLNATSVAASGDVKVFGASRAAELVALGFASYVY